MKKWLLGCLITVLAILMLGSALAEHTHDFQVLWPDSVPLDADGQPPLQLPVNLVCRGCDYKPDGLMMLRSSVTPTCMEKGSATYGNSTNNKTYPLPALGHAPVKHDGKASTCTEKGYKAYETCSRSYCSYTTYEEIDLLPHDTVPHDGKAATCTEAGWEAYETCKNCDYTTYQALPKLAHDTVQHDGKTATCTESGWAAYETCKNCDYTTYQALPASGHRYVSAVTQPTCTRGGYTIHTCTGCGDSFTDRKTAARGHWYGDWTPGNDDTHTANCRRSGCGYQNAVACAAIACKLMADDETVQELTLCPVCGEISDGARLALAESASAKGNPLPGSEALVRMGQTASGEMLLSVCFERGGSMTQPAGKIKITLPAEMLEGHTLRLLDETGTEAELTFAVQGKEATFTLDFADGDSAAKLIRLVPAV